MIRKEIETLAINIDEVHTHPANVRQGDVGAISESLKAHGQYRPIVYQQSTHRILAGNHTYKAAKALGWTHIAATPVICDDEQALRILLADNKANDLATYDEPELIELLKQLADTSDGLLGTLFDEDELDSLIEDNSHFELPSEVDDVPDKAPSITNAGDVWLLGKHKVMCGDSTNGEQVKALMDGLEADLVWTDPPYGVAYVGKTKDALTIENDDMDIDALQEFLTKAFKAGYEVTKKGGCWYVAAPSGNIFQAFSIPLSILGIWRHTLVWVKDSLVMGRADYHYRHESIFYGWKEGAAHQAPPDRKQDTVWEIPRPHRSAEHPTMKPVELIAKAIKNSTNQNQIVLDLFGGSGSTLIAAEETNRIGYLMELDPRYVDVICARYQKHTGQQPVLAATGEAHDFTPDAD
jgi:site-specific DNA-methyltransferase (adenine-specific)